MVRSNLCTSLLPAAVAVADADAVVAPSYWLSWTCHSLPCVQFATSIKDYMFSCMIQQRKAADGALLTVQPHPDPAGAAAAAAAGGCRGVDAGGNSHAKAPAWPSHANATASALSAGRPAERVSAASAPVGAQQEDRVSFLVLNLQHLLIVRLRCAKHCRTGRPAHRCASLHTFQSSYLLKFVLDKTLMHKSSRCCMLATLVLPVLLCAVLQLSQLKPEVVQQLAQLAGSGSSTAWQLQLLTSGSTSGGSSSHMHLQLKQQQQQDHPAAAAALALALPAALLSEQLVIPSTAAAVAAAAAAAGPADEEEGEELALPYHATDGAYSSSTACTNVTAAIHEAALMHPGAHVPSLLGVPMTAGAATRSTSAATMLRLIPKRCQKQQPWLAQVNPVDAGMLEGACSASCGSW